MEDDVNVKKGELEKKRINRKKLEAQREAILARKKEDAKKLKELDETLSRLQRNDETKMGMSFWRFFVKCRPDEYAEILKSSDFDGYVSSPNIRSLFGLDVPEKPQKNNGNSPENVPAGYEKRLYLAVSYKEQTEAKKIALDVFGEDYRPDFFDFDKEKKQWFLRGDGMTKAEAFSKWLPEGQAPRCDFEG